MREKEEGRSRRDSQDEHVAIDEDPSPALAQPLETLRSGYSWIHALQARHPGWRPDPVEGSVFTVPAKKLAESRVSLVSLAGVYRKGQRPFSTSPGMIPAHLRKMHFKDQGDWSFREISLEADSTELSIAHAHYDPSEAEEDINCIFPWMRLVELEVEGFIGQCADIHYSMMGYVPDPTLILATVEKEIVPRLKNRGVDIAVVSGGCEMSHQSAALIQRRIEAAGIPTVGVSVCPDITEFLLPPRAVTLRFPMGSPFGVSMDAPMQLRILRDALSLIESAEPPGKILHLPYEWIKE